MIQILLESARDRKSFNRRANEDNWAGCIGCSHIFYLTVLLCRAPHLRCFCSVPHKTCKDSAGGRDPFTFQCVSRAIPKRAALQGGSQGLRQAGVRLGDERRIRRTSSLQPPGREGGSGGTGEVQTSFRERGSRRGQIGVGDSHHTTRSVTLPHSRLATPPPRPQASRHRCPESPSISSA